MIHQHIEFHNVAALEPVNGLPGLCMVRLPRAVRDQVNPAGHLHGAAAAGVELRFVCPGRYIRVGLIAHETDVTVHVYRGEFLHSNHIVPVGVNRVIHLEQPANFAAVAPDALRSGPFSPDLWRIQIDGHTVNFLGLESYGAPVRSPKPEETPRLRWLAYGSSITHASGKGYPHQAARKLGVDVLNKGLAGGCHCESVIADYLATGEAWDFATLEMGVNMRGVFTPAEFESRARKFIGILRKAKPEAPLVLITHFLNAQHHPVAGNEENPARRNQLAFDDILRAIAGEYKKDAVFLVEGTDILKDFSGLYCDLLHPSDYGHIQMGENLARELAPIIQSHLG